MIRICVASENGNKLRQFGEIFSGLATDVLIYTAKELGFTEYPPEDAGTFYGNSRIKACAVRDYLVEKGEGGEYYVIADDSGISVDALGGAPGVHSARYAGTHAPDSENNRKLIAELKKLGDCDRSAHYTCVITVVNPDGMTVSTAGRVDGRVIDEPRGSDGFGYDPFFYIDSLGRTFAELDSATRNGMSHRGQALRKAAEIIIRDAERR
ncbi:MAG: non-canonical purine NTP pyrophosphatase [Clostridia bacterium]|nr:non-canonical purine NTP pyrophosphatase [Clostridia bacterium]